MLGNIEAGSICRDDRCERKGIHPWHPIDHEPKPHHRPKSKAPWKIGDQKSLLGAVMRSTSARVPKWFQEIGPDVRDDYGPISDRSLWRAIETLVKRGHLLKVDIGLAFAAYIRPMGRKRLPGRLDSPEEMRDYMLGIVEIHPTTTES